VLQSEACVVGFTSGSRGKVPGKTCEKEEEIIVIIIQFNSFIYVLDNSQIRPITAKH
jgi:hypothetical protein